MKRKGSPVAIPQMRGSAEYVAWLDRLQDRARHLGCEVEGRSDLVELALRKLGNWLELPAPRRCPPRGTNRHGEPRRRPE